jgi:hypothetical protein
MGTTDAEDWRRYWETAIDGGRRRQIELAAANPVRRWVVADAPGLVDEPVGIDPVDLHERPDAVRSAARAGFETFVAGSELSGHDDDRYDYETLPIHVTTVGRVDGIDVSFEDALADANALTTVENAPVVDSPVRRREAAVVTYECPCGHETTVRQPLLRTWSLETCGTGGCSCPVLPADARTRARTVVRFAVETNGEALPCVATGKYGTDSEFEQLRTAANLHLTGIGRLLTDGSGDIEPHYEVLAAEPASP